MLVAHLHDRHLGHVRGEFVDLEGCRLYYFAAGTRGAGEPVVFIHGFPAASHLWSDVIRDIPAGHRLVVVDLLGFGRSDRPATASLTAGAHADRVLKLMDDLRIEAACIVGHGMGGAVAQHLAVHAASRVTRLGLVNSTAFDEWPRRAARVARAVAGTPLGRMLGAPLLAGVAHSSLLRGFEDREEGRHALDHYLRAFTTRLGTDALIAQLRAMRDDSVATLGGRLGEIRVPTAVIWGANDPWLPVALGERLCAAIPGATLEIIPGARHFSPNDAPERVAAAVAALLAR